MMSYFPWKNIASWFVTLFLPTEKYTEGNKEGATRGGGLKAGFRQDAQSCCVSETLPWRHSKWLPGNGHMCWHACGQSSLAGHLSRLVFPRAFHWQTLPPGTEAQRFWNKPWWEREGEKKLWLAQTTRKKSATQSFQPNSEQLLFIVHASWVGFSFLLMQSLLDFSKGGTRTPLLCCLAYADPPGCQFLSDISTQVLSAVSQAKNEGRSKLQATEWPSQPPGRFGDLKYQEACTCHSAGSLTSCRQRRSNKKDF